MDITGKADIKNIRVKLKINEELGETTYLDRIYLRIDGYRSWFIIHFFATS